MIRSTATAVLLTLLIAATSAATSRTSRAPPRGHLQHMGLHGDPGSILSVHYSELTPEMFWKDHVEKTVPVVIREAIKHAPALTDWTAASLEEKYPNLEVKMEAKFEKKSIGKNGPEKDILSRFFKQWFPHDSYIISQLPTPMGDDVFMPDVLACGSGAHNLIEPNLWVSSGNTSSTLHKDAYNTVNCQIVGEKDWLMIHPNQIGLIPMGEEPEPPELATSGFSLVDPERVDLVKFPNFAKVEFQRVRMVPGDCLFVPGSYLHQVRSMPTLNIAATALFGGKTMTRDVYVPWGTDAVACPEALTQVPVSHVNRTFSTADFAWMFDGTPGGLHTMGFEDPQTFKKNLYVYTFMENQVDLGEMVQQTVTPDQPILPKEKLLFVWQLIIYEMVATGLDSRHVGRVEQQAFRSRVQNALAEGEQLFAALKEYEKKLWGTLDVPATVPSTQLHYRALRDSPRNLFRDATPEFQVLGYYTSLYDSKANEQYSLALNGDDSDDHDADDMETKGRVLAPFLRPLFATEVLEMGEEQSEEGQEDAGSNDGQDEEMEEDGDRKRQEMDSDDLFSDFDRAWEDGEDEVEQDDGRDDRDEL